MNHSELILKIDGVTVRYGYLNALDDVSLEVQRGEFLTLLGPSGSGKTTLLNVISGGLFPTAGRVLLDGRDITTTSPRFRGIGMVFQNFALMPHLTVFENVAFPLRIRGVPKGEIEARVNEVLSLVKLPDLGGRKPKQLSGGQQQRIAIARALVYKPPLILMDEPLGALDRKLRQQMQFEIKRLHDELGLSMVYVTHDQEEALTMSDRICVMGGGKIQDIGSPEKIYGSPSTVFSADFFGGTNIFRGQATRVAGRVGIDHDGFGFVTCDTMDELPSKEVGWMVRPEQIRILAGEESAENVVRGKIDRIVLTGQVTQLLIETETGGKLVVSCLTNGSAQSYAMGDSITCGWSGQATILLQIDKEGAALV